MRIFSGNIYCLYTYLPVIEDIRKAFHDSELRLDYSQNNIPESTEHRIYKQTHILTIKFPRSTTSQVYPEMQIPKYQTAACIDNPHLTAKLDIRHDVPVPEPRAGQVLVKLEWTGFW